VHDEPSHWLHEISISKAFHHHFWPGLMAGSVIWGHSQTRMPNYCDMVGPSLVFSHAFLCVHPFVFALNDYIFDSKMVTFINKWMGYYGNNQSLSFPKSKKQSCPSHHLDYFLFFECCLLLV
jgi:hypothetical protein